MLIYMINYTFKQENGFTCYFTVGFFLVLLYGLWNWI